MDSFIFKFINVFSYKGDEKFNIFQIFKGETLQYLNDNNLKNVDYKSVGSLFGMNYNQDNLKNIDILIELEYDFYILKKFIYNLLKYFCKRKILTTKTVDEIIKCYAFDEEELIKAINKQNEREKYKLLQKKVWQPLYNTIKKNYKLNNSNIININNNNLNIKNIIDYNNINSEKEMVYENMEFVENNKWKSIKKKNNYKKKEKAIDEEEIKMNYNNKYLLLEDEICTDEEEYIRELKKEDKKNFSEFKKYNMYDIDDRKEYNERLEKLDKSEKNVKKIIDKISNEVKIVWADIMSETD